MDCTSADQLLSSHNTKELTEQLCDWKETLHPCIFYIDDLSDELGTLILLLQRYIGFINREPTQRNEIFTYPNYGNAMFITFSQRFLQTQCVSRSFPSEFQDQMT